MALLNEVTGGKGVAIGITTGKALIGHVKEREVILLLDDIADLAPLLLCWVNTSWVVSACMEEHNAVVRYGLEIRDHALEV